MAMLYPGGTSGDIRQQAPNTIGSVNPTLTNAMMQGNPVPGAGQAPNTGVNFNPVSPDPSQANYQQPTPQYMGNQFPFGIPTTNPATIGNVPQIFGQPLQFGGGGQQGQQIPPGAQWVTAQDGSQILVGPDGQMISNNPAAFGGGASTGTGNQAPQVNPGQIANVPQVSPQSIMAPQSIVGAMGGPGAYSPAASVAGISNYLQPQFQQQDNALQEALASSGIVGGTTGKAMADLGSQQQTTLMNDIQPYILSRQQMQQQATGQDVSNQMTTNIQNVANNLQAQGMNQATAQQTAIQQAANALQASGMNAQLAYQVASQNAQMGMQGQLANQNAALQGSEFNANNINAGQQFDISNLLKSGMNDQATYNQFLQYVMGLQNQDWLAQLGATSNIAGAGLGAQANAFQPVYQQPGQVNLGGIASAFAPQPNSFSGIGGGGGTGFSGVGNTSGYNEPGVFFGGG